LPRGPLHLAVLYGEPFEPFVAPIVADLAGGAAGLGHELAAVSVERAAAEPAHCARVDRLYVLPFDLPAHVELPAAAFVRQLFPRAEVLNSMEAHELCWDRVRTDRRLVARGVPVPESLYTESPDEVRAFVAEHQFAILKERRSCGGQGHVVLCDAHEALAGEAGSRRFVVELGGDAAAARKLRDGVLIYPPPFFVQRLVGERGPRDRFTPGRILRAYVLAGRVAFWTERYRDRYRRPADWIVNVSLGARYRFVLETSEELRKLALRAASAVGMQVGVIDIVRSAGGPFVLEADTDGQHMYIDRQFKQIPDYRLAFDLDRLIAAALADEEIPALAAPV
jgi:glutathione synthase/RimK-type ligase-like ATP-grasp enzyme